MAGYKEENKPTDCVTVNVETSFSRPAYIGDIIFIDCKIKTYGKKSVVVEVAAFRENKKKIKEKMAQGKFVFVARINGNPHDFI